MPQPTSAAELLRNPDEEKRREAFDRISVEMDDDLAREILAIIASDDSDDVRADAVVALGPAVEECGIEYMDDDLPESIPYTAPLSREAYGELTSAIRAVYEDESQPTIVRRRALEVLVRDPQPWQKDAIRRDFASSDRDWKMTALFAMGYVRGFERELLEVLRTVTDGDLLYEAVRAAGNAEATEAAPILEAFALSEETDRDVRLEAIAALPSVDPECFDLLDELADSTDDEIRAAAEEALEDLQMFGEDLDDEDESS